MRYTFNDWRFLFLLLSSLLILMACLLPKISIKKNTFNWFVMVDITQSMNATDYIQKGTSISRLDKTKHNLLYLLKQLPCGSKLGLGVFSERSNAPLFFPVEVCSNYELITASITNLDWRMAWVADSNIARALENVLSLMSKPELADVHLAFITDGHEAPPINPDYEPDFSEYQSDGIVPGAIQLAAQQRKARDSTVEFSDTHEKSPGVIIGTGGYVPVRIPKFDEDGIQRGYFTADDVPHATRFGLPKDPSKIPGYVPRNAEWGASAPTGTEHLTEVREDYLKELSKKTNMHYLHMDDETLLLKQLTQSQYALLKTVPSRVGQFPALIALLFLSAIYIASFYVYLERFLKSSNKKLSILSINH